MNHMRRVLMAGALVALPAFALTACDDDDDNDLEDTIDDAATSVLGEATEVAGEATEDEQSDGDEVTFDLDSQNDSGFDGEVTLTAQGDSTMVVVEMDGEGIDDEERPLHVHEGTCDDLATEPAYPLENVVDGRSETVIPVALSELQSEDYAINAHESESSPDVYIACGEIPGE